MTAATTHDLGPINDALLALCEAGAARPSGDGRLSLTLPYPLVRVATQRVNGEEVWSLPEGEDAGYALVGIQVTFPGARSADAGASPGGYRVGTPGEPGVAWVEAGLVLDRARMPDLRADGDTYVCVLPAETEGCELRVVGRMPGGVKVSEVPLDRFVALLNQAAVALPDPAGPEGEQLVEAVFKEIGIGLGETALELTVNVCPAAVAEHAAASASRATALAEVVVAEAAGEQERRRGAADSARATGPVGARSGRQASVRSRRQDRRAPPGQRVPRGGRAPVQRELSVAAATYAEDAEYGADDYEMYVYRAGDGTPGVDEEAFGSLGGGDVPTRAWTGPGARRPNAASAAGPPARGVAGRGLERRPSGDVRRQGRPGMCRVFAPEPQEVERPLDVTDGSMAEMPFESLCAAALGAWEERGRKFLARAMPGGDRVGDERAEWTLAHSPVWQVSTFLQFCDSAPVFSREAIAEEFWIDDQYNGPSPSAYRHLSRAASTGGARAVQGRLGLLPSMRDGGYKADLLQLGAWATSLPHYATLVGRTGEAGSVIPLVPGGGDSGRGSRWAGGGRLGIWQLGTQAFERLDRSDDLRSFIMLVPAILTGSGVREDLSIVLSHVCLSVVDEAMRAGVDVGAQRDAAARTFQLAITSAANAAERMRGDYGLVQTVAREGRDAVRDAIERARHEVAAPFRSIAAVRRSPARGPGTGRGPGGGGYRGSRSGPQGADAGRASRGADGDPSKAASSDGRGAGQGGRTPPTAAGGGSPQKAAARQ